jgi:hypothetical protein
MVGDGTHIFALAAGQLHVLDVTTLSSPLDVASVDVHAVGLTKQGQLVYVIGSAALSIVDVADAKQPRLVGEVEVPQGADSVALAGDTAYVGGDAPYLTVVDVSDPTNPTTIGTVPYPANAVDIHGTLAFVTWQIGSVKYGGPRGLTILDASDPATPVPISYLPSDRGVGSWGLMVEPPLAFITEEYGVLVVDVSDPKQPREVAFHEIRNCFGTTCYLWLAKVGAVRGDLVYVATGPGGLWILQLPGPASAAGCAPDQVTATDGRTLAAEPTTTQTLFRVVWGSSAECRWATEHNQELRRPGANSGARYDA